MLERLIKYGVGNKSSDYDGRNCIDIAKDNKNDNIIKLFEKYNIKIADRPFLMNTSLRE